VLFHQATIIQAVSLWFRSVKSLNFTIHLPKDVMASPENFYSSFFFGRLAEVITKFSGSTAAFIITVGIA